MKLVTPERHYVAVICTEFHPNRSRNVQSTRRSSATLLNVRLTKPIFTKFSLA